MDIPIKTKINLGTLGLNKKKNVFDTKVTPKEQIGISLIPKEKIEEQLKHQTKYIRNSKNFNNTKLENYISYVKQQTINESRCNSS